MSIPQGFRSWIKQSLNDDRDKLASYLFDCIMSGPKDSIAWELLKQTGDRGYTPETFKKAADICLKQTVAL